MNWLQQDWAHASVALLLTVLLAVLVRTVFQRALAARLGAGQSKPISRIAFWAVAIGGSAGALKQVGFDLSVLMGAAGILTVAVGFASQTSASNLVSGLFLLAERPFQIGDSVRIGVTSGEVLSVDLLSVKMRTFDNLFVRVPNETVMKAEIINLTRFPVRRFDLVLRLPPTPRLGEVEGLLLQTLATENVVLNEPAPQIIWLGTGERWIEVQVSAWAVRQRFLELRGRVTVGVFTMLQNEGIPAVPTASIASARPPNV